MDPFRSLGIVSLQAAASTSILARMMAHRSVNVSNWLRSEKNERLGQLALAGSLSAGNYNHRQITHKAACRTRKLSHMGGSSSFCISNTSMPIILLNNRPFRLVDSALRNVRIHERCRKQMCVCQATSSIGLIATRYFQHI